MKRKALSARVAVVITLLLLSGIINIGLLSIIFSEGAVSATFMGTVILAEVIVLLILTYLAAEYVLKPYQEMRRLYQRFIDGQVYEELFDAEYELMPQWCEVMKKIRHLLNKQDAIRMSKKQQGDDNCYPCRKRFPFHPVPPSTSTACGTPYGGLHAPL